MLDHQDIDTRTLRARLKQEAQATFERLNQAFSHRVGHMAAQTHWSPATRVAAPHLTEAERLMGVTLPADLAACYEASNGMLETCGWRWWPLHDVALKFQLMNTIAYELRLGEPGWFAPEGSFSADGAVRADAWHRGWIPVAESSAQPPGYLLCVDTSPGPHGQWGQLIEVQNPRFPLSRGEPVEPARRVASGLLAYWDRLAGVLTESPVPEAVAFWAEQHRERRLRADLVPLALEVTHGLDVVDTLRSRQLAQLADPASTSPPTEPPLKLHALLDSQGHGLTPNPWRLTRERTLHVTRIHTGSDHIRGAYQPSGDEEDALPWLHRWAQANTSAFTLLVGWYGDGKTDLLLGLVDELSQKHRADATQPWPFYIDLAALTDHPLEQAPETLSDAIGAELARRHLPDARATVLRAVSDGACVLVLDHAEAVAPYHDGALWEWAQHLPPASNGMTRRRARVLIACTQEFYDTDEHLTSTALTLCQARLDNNEFVYVAGLPAVNEDAKQAWLQAVGLDVETDPAMQAAWTRFANDTHGLPARVNALRTVLQSTAPLRWPQVYAAWWQHCVPADLGVDADAMTQHAIWIGLTQLLASDSGHISHDQHASLVREQWPQASAARQARLRMASRVGLRLRVEQSTTCLDRGIEWLAHGIVVTLAEGDLNSVVSGLIEGPRSAMVVRQTAHAWFEAGHTRPPHHISQWLQTALPARAAGALFQLGCEMAREFAWRESRNAAQSYPDCLRDALALSLPSPLSTAQLVGADLRGAEFYDMVLEDADLSGANLAGAKCQRAEFIRVRLDGACADGANFDEARFTDVVADQLVARASSWLGARWNRQWPTADLSDAKSNVPGVTPGTAATEFRMHPTTGAAKPPFRRLACSPDGRWLAALGGAGTLGVWRTHDLTPAWHVQLPGGPIADVLDLCFSLDGQHIITSHGDATLRGWSVIEGTLAAECHRPQFFPVHQLLPLGEDGHLLGLSMGGQAAILDKGLKRASGVPSAISWPMGGATYGAAVRRSGHASTLACVRSFRDGGVFEFVPLKPKRKLEWGPRNVWRMASGPALLAVLEPDALWIGDPNANAAAWHIPRPQAVVHGDTYQQLVQEAQQRMGRFVGNTTPGPLLDERQSFDRQARIADVVFSPDGSWLVCVGGGQNESIAVDTRSGAVHPLDANASMGAQSATFTADGRLLLGGEQLVACPLPTP